MSDSFLKLENVSRHYLKKRVLESISLEVKKGERIALSGKNGAGKTTLLRILSTQITPSSGTVYLNGHCILKERGQFKSYIGYQPAAENTFFNKIKGIDNLYLFGQLNGLSKKEIDKRLERDWSHIAPLQEALKTRYLLCSTGMKQTLSLCRAMLHNAPLLLLDEPMKSLDKETTNSLMDMIIHYTSDNKRSVFFTSHSEYVVNYMATKEFKLQDGLIC